MQITIPEAARTKDAEGRLLALSFVIRILDDGGENLEWPYTLTLDELAQAGADASVPDGIIARETKRALVEFRKFAYPDQIIREAGSLEGKGLVGDSVDGLVGATLTEAQDASIAIAKAKP